MKKLFYILLFVPIALFGQSNEELVDELSIYVDLNAGWNMIGFTCQIEKDLVAAFSEIQGDIEVIKDNDGNVYLPEFGFNGIGNLIPGLGYQIKLYNPIFNFSLNNSCLFGCMSQWADNYYPAALIDDNSCYLEGCNLDWADNFNQNVTINDGSCFRYGCTNIAAINYDSFATIENGFCLSYQDLIFVQPENTGGNMAIGFNDPNLDQFEGGQIGAFFDVDNDGFPEVVGLETISQGFTGLSLWWQPGLASGWYPDFWIRHDNNYILIESSSLSFSGYVTNGLFLGNNLTLIMTVECNDPNSINYANINYTGVEILDLGNCTSDIYGCTKHWGDNFNPEATIDDGTCINYDACWNQNCCGTLGFYPSPCDEIAYPCVECSAECIMSYGCTNPTAINYNPMHTVDDGSCLY